MLTLPTSGLLCGLLGARHIQQGCRLIFMIALALYPIEEGLGFKVRCASPRIGIRSECSKIMSSPTGLLAA